LGALFLRSWPSASEESRLNSRKQTRQPACSYWAHGQFVRIAKGSEAEVLNHLIDARDQRLITDDEFLLAEHLTKRALKAANGLIRYLESTPDVPPPRYVKKETTKA
jgi:hypothetical protein